MHDTYETGKWLLSHRYYLFHHIRYKSLPVGRQSWKRAGTKHLSNAIMLKRLKELYQQYKPYVRVDLVMYGVLLLLIVLYFIYSLIVD